MENGEKNEKDLQLGTAEIEVGGETFYCISIIGQIEWHTNLGSGKSHYLCGYPPFSLDWYESLMKKHNLDGENSK